jgi:hypothetical protein
MQWMLLSLLTVGFCSLPLSVTPATMSAESFASCDSKAVLPAIHAVPAPNPSAHETKAEEITKANWQQHPKIKAVRAVVESVKAGLNRGSFKVSKRQFEYCEPYQDTKRTMATDVKGRVRRYERQGGSDDSSLTTEHYYDESGRLRFVLIQGGAVNGSKLEHRIYFDESGKRIWEEHKYVAGPGYTFPEVWPDEQLQIADPAKAFAAKSPCPEIQSRGNRRKRARR